MKIRAIAGEASNPDLSGLGRGAIPERTEYFGFGFYGSPSSPAAGDRWTSPDCRIWIADGRSRVWKRKMSGEIFGFGGRQDRAPPPCGPPAPPPPSPPPATPPAARRARQLGGLGPLLFLLILAIFGPRG